MTCPICDRATDANYRPFCSRRCADLDLSNWLTGRYRVPSDEVEGIENHSETVEAPVSGPH